MTPGRRPVGIDDMPRHLVGGITRYSRYGIAPGEFLRCVMENDVRGAVRVADSRSLRGLGATVLYLEATLPPQSWGSRAKVGAWIESKAKRPAPHEATGAGQDFGNGS